MFPFADITCKEIPCTIVPHPVNTAFANPLTSSSHFRRTITYNFNLPGKPC